MGLFVWTEQDGLNAMDRIGALGTTITLFETSKCAVQVETKAVAELFQ